MKRLNKLLIGICILVLLVGCNTDTYCAFCEEDIVPFANDEKTNTFINIYLVAMGYNDTCINNEGHMKQECIDYLYNSGEGREITSIYHFDYDIQDVCRDYPKWLNCSSPPKVTINYPKNEMFKQKD